MAKETTKIDPAERGRLFSQMTRRYWQSIASQTGAENGVVSFNVPKVRLLAGMRVKVEAILTATHSSSASYAAHEDSPHKFVKRVEVSLNNGFSPFSISGQGLYAYNLTLGNKANLDSGTSGRGRVVQPLVASSGGTANSVRAIYDLPLALNERDPIGYILAQNEETLVTVNVSLGAVADLAPAASGYTFAVSGIVVSLLTDTFSVPAIKEAFPDIGVLKMVNERTETIIAGENIIKLPTGQTYRKLGFILYNATPARVADSIITSNIELVLGQTDMPYRISPVDLAAINADEYNGALPAGMFMFDFSDNGIPNLGSARDLVDTEQVTEFWLKFTSSAAGTAKVIYETLSRLK